MILCSLAQSLQATSRMTQMGGLPINSHGKLVWNITYDSDGYLEGFRETIQIGEFQ